MKRHRNKLALLTGALLLSQLALPASAADYENQLVIIHTNDIHCSTDRNMGYDGVAAYRDQWVEELGEDYVILMDAGDVIQGGPLGTLTSGQALIDIMNAVDYDYFAPGNHEFDYGMEQGLYLMDQLTATVLSSNFVDLTTNELVYAAYDVRDFGQVQVGFVGVTTPESMTKATPTYFQDENGNYIYSFGESGTDLYDYVQAAIDSAIAEGADFIVGVGHMGIDDASMPWRSTDLIENTVGFDLFLDGHSHTLDSGSQVLDKAGNIVIVNQAGSKFDAVGEIIIDLDTLEFTVGYVDESYSEKSASVTAVMESIDNEFNAIMAEVVATTEVDLLMLDPVTEENLVRNQETNLGNLVADAYRSLLGTDVSIANGGGIRANILSGDITYEDIISVHPFNNETCILTISGQILLDALEMGAKSTPDNSGGFFQVSGLTYEINTAIPSSIITDDIGNFLSVEGEYRVRNVLVGGQSLDLDKIYTIGAIDYILLNYGDGMTMFQGAQLVDDHIMVDNEVLIRYIKEELGGVIGEEYANLEGRITVLYEENTSENQEPEVAPEPEVMPEPEVAPEPEVMPEPEVAPEPEIMPEPEVAPEQGQVDVIGTYLVKSGDNLSFIARDVLGNSNQWTEIYAMNRDIIFDPNCIYIGQLLKMPA